LGVQATFVVQTQRDWFGDPRLGTFTVYLDGNNAGKVAPRGRLVLSSTIGEHVVRVRQWWYLSPRLTVDLREGSPLVVEVDVSRRDSFIRRFLTFMFAPWRALSIEISETGDVPAPTSWSAATRARAIWVQTCGIVGALLALIGLDHHSITLEVLGAVIWVASQLVAARQGVTWYRTHRRRD
jgi:hypothetical protein